jgi:hypothetical protein
MRSLSQRRLPEVRAAIERAEAMRDWLEAAGDCTCSTADECALFGQPGDERAALRIVQVAGGVRLPPRQTRGARETVGEAPPAGVESAHPETPEVGRG